MANALWHQQKGFCKENAANSKQFIYSKDESQWRGNLSFYCTSPWGTPSALKTLFYYHLEYL